MITYPVQPDTFHITETQQWSSLIIVAGVMLIAVFAAKALLWDEWTAAWSIDDTEAEIADAADDLYTGRDQHRADVRWAMRKARRDAERRAAA